MTTVVMATSKTASARYSAQPADIVARSLSKYSIGSGGSQKCVSHELCVALLLNSFPKVVVVMRGGVVVTR